MTKHLYSAKTKKSIKIVPKTLKFSVYRLKNINIFRTFKKKVLYLVFKINSLLIHQ